MSGRVPIESRNGRWSKEPVMGGQTGDFGPPTSLSLGWPSDDVLPRLLEIPDRGVTLVEPKDALRLNNSKDFSQ